MPPYAYAILAAGWVAWFTPFVLAQLARRHAAPAQTVDRRARWGMLLVALAYTLLWQNRFWERPLPPWRLALCIPLFLSAALLSWTAPRALGRHWRVDAGLSSGHELVTSGPYRLVRHPIYTSMLCVFFGTGLLITPLPVLVLAAAVFIAGTEVRVRTEERLLAAHFGSRFRDYQRKVPAYIPLLK